LAAFLVLCSAAGLVQAATVDCDSCADCNAKIAVASGGDTILLNTSFSTSSSCLGVPVGINNITIDCQGNTVWGSNDGCLYGIGSYLTYYITIQNCNFYGFDGAGLGLDTAAYWSIINSSFRWGNFTGYCGGTGINLLDSQVINLTNVDLSDNAFGFNENYACDYNTFINITASRNIYGDGFAFGADSKYNVLDGLVANDNSWYGLAFIWGANYNTVANVNLSGNAVHGIYFLDSSYNNLSSFTVSGSGTDGIYFDDGGGSSSGNMFYNGIFNDTVNYVSVDLDNVNYWNTTLQLVDNIIGGAKLGGNFWSGYSESCTDANFDGICDVPLVLDASNTDELPLRYYAMNGSLSEYALVLAYQPYASAGETVPIHAYLSFEGAPYNLSEVEIMIDGMTAPMSWDGASDSFVVYWVPTMNGDYPFNVTAIAPHLHLHAFGLIKVRTPFNVTVRLWNDNNMSTSYRNEFAWVYLTKDVDSTLHVLFGRDKFSCPPEGSDECYWHGRYANGSATVTLYEPGNYTMYLIGNNIEWKRSDPLSALVPCAFCPPWIVQTRLRLNLGAYYFSTDDSLDLYYSPAELYYVGGFGGIFASWLNVILFAVIGFIAFIVVLALTGSLKSGIAALILLPALIWLLTHLTLWG
jgi:parallel beta-helix repeat protein